ncbi:cytochrome-c peroxidase [Pseudovibrio sp. SCP19]|uniref:cytochrome-c peroxidase n=1 Tax=Pseudovibrio sp. SCP19 TaxID=3141374 RepID=UPI00333D5AE6
MRSFYQKSGFALLSLAGCLVISASYAQDADVSSKNLSQLENLGNQLFFDFNLSKNRTMSCATCHTPETGFADPRDNGFDAPVSTAVSLGDDGESIGDRNAPSAGYAAFSPNFHKTKEGKFVGGQFWDGREKDLEGQAGGPPLNPIEMGMPSKASVVERIKENDDYIATFKQLFGESIFESDEEAYVAMTKAIAAFERTETFAPFDSKYDRFLRGEIELSPQEELGRILFFSPQFTNCNVCHQLKKVPGSEGETFTNYQYFNIGVPVNKAVRAANGSPAGTVDHGLLANPAVDDKFWDGKFKTSTLRNVAVTGPYMHNGVFKDLKTVVQFYNRYNSRKKSAQINPETGKPWGAPEVPATLDVKELTTGPALDDKRINALVAFMKTLTDERYEHLLEKE